jgi:hypothetical protein
MLFAFHSTFDFSTTLRSIATFNITSTPAYRLALNLGFNLSFNANTGQYCSLLPFSAI